MRQRSFIILAACLAALILGSVAAWAYDSSRDDLIADGVTIAGVDVGGLRKAKAREVVRSRVTRGLELPVRVRYRHKAFTLRPREVGLRADVNGMVDEAVNRSRDGMILGRVFRDVTGGDENTRVPAEVTYSRPAVSRFLKRVEAGLNRSPRDAHVEFPEVKRVPARNGIEVESSVLEAKVSRALRDPQYRLIEPTVRVTHAKVKYADLRKRWSHLIVINRGGFQLRFYRHLHLVKTYPIAVGQIGLETPAGLYHIESKQVNPSWHVPNSAWAGSLAGRVIPPGPDDPLKARWMGFVDGAGIHGTDEPGSIGSAASHGCIRMFIPDVIALYDKVPLNTPVYVA
jgi:lipoprotein-anchoring transpeptidase ErfK/SrfK